MNKKKDNGIWNLGSRGYLLIVLGILLYYIGTAFKVDGLNTIIPGFAEVLNVSDVTLYAINTAIGIIAVAFLFLVGVLNEKFGPRTMILVGCIMTIVGLICYAVAKNVVVFTIGFALIIFAGPIFMQISLQTLISNWFPTKKDLLNGWVTIGANLASALFVLTFVAMQASLGFQNVFWVYVGFMVIVTIIAFTFRDNPEDLGCFPDNDTSMTHEEAKALLEKGEEYAKSSPWTVKKILSTKQSWQIIAVYGIILVITIGIMSTIIPTLLSRGVEMMKAVGIMSTSAIIAIPASWLWGVIGTKKGTKFATLTIYGVMTLAVIFMLIQKDWAIWPTTICLGCFLGAGNNVMPSMIMTVFGRYDFPKAVGTIVPIINLFLAFAPSIIGIPLSLTGTYTTTYYCLLVVVVIGFIVALRMSEKCIGREE